MLRLVIVSCLLAGTAIAMPPPLEDGGNRLPKLLRIAAPARALAAPARAAVSYQDESSSAVPFYAHGYVSVNRATNVFSPGQYRFSSPNYPSNYPTNTGFRFTARGKDGQTISISCNPFAVQSHPKCAYDYLSINGVKYCGTGTISAITATTLSVEFRSNKSGTKSGFQCVITVPEAGADTTTTTTTTTVVPPSGGCRCGQQPSARVVGGADAAAGQFRWQAGLVQPGSSRTFCGGSIINDRYVLTAAHCTAGSSANQIQVLLGDLHIGVNDAGEDRFSVIQIIDHPQYTDAVESGMDFSLLKLDRAITFSATIAPVCLPEAGERYAGRTAIASGYGRLGKERPQATTLQYVELPVWEQSSCARRWGSTLKDNMICAGGLPEGGKSVCMGDSGGPLVTEDNGSFRLIGVVSFGEPCAVANRPDVFARVTDALSWIADNTDDAQTCSP